MSASSRVRWGILGAAQISSKFAGANTATGAVVALASRDKSKGIAFVQTKLKREALDAPGSGGIAVFPSYDELLACPDVDAVYIPLPNDIHFDWARKALVAGKHVFVEKPMCLTTADVEELAKLAASKRLCAAEAMVPMYHPQLGRIREALPRLGRLRTAKLVHIHPLPEGCIAFTPSSSGGGALWGLGCYTVALAQTLFGQLTPLTAHKVVRPNGCDVTFEASFVSAEGVGIVINCGIVGVKSQGLVVTGDLESLDVPHPFRPDTDGPSAFRLKSVEAGVPEELIAVPELPAFTAEVQSFEKSVLRGEPPVYSLADTAKATALLVQLHSMASSFPA